jgi:hypothetical protein
MADEKMEDKCNQIYAGGPPESRPFRINETGIYPGMVVTRSGQSGNNIIKHVAGSGHVPLGVVGKRRGWALGTPYTVGLSAPVFRCGSGTEVHCFLQAAVGPIPVAEGFDCGCASEGGKVKKYVGGGGTTGSDSEQQKIGKFQQVRAGSATNDQIVRVKLST